MCEVLALAWERAERFDRLLPWATALERLGVAGFGWGVAWWDGDGAVQFFHPCPAADPGRCETAGPTTRGRAVDRFQHVVLFKFPVALTAEEETELLRKVRAWPREIDVNFLTLRFGADVSGRARGYQYCLFSEFESEERMKAYQAHPVHQAFGAWVYARDCEVLAFDHAVDEATRIAGP